MTPSDASTAPDVSARSAVTLSTLDRWSSHRLLVDARNAAKSGAVLDVELPRSSAAIVVVVALVVGVSLQVFGGSSGEGDRDAGDIDQTPVDHDTSDHDPPTTTPPTTTPPTTSPVTTVPPATPGVSPRKYAGLRAAVMSWPCSNGSSRSATNQARSMAISVPRQRQR